jgi:hypothetical protein
MPKLNKAKITADVFMGAKRTGSVSGVVQMTTDDSGPMEAPTLVTPKPLPEGTICVSGGKAKMVAFKACGNEVAMEQIKLFVKQEMLKPRKVVIDEAVQGDFNGDGKVDYLIAFNSGATGDDRRMSDFDCAFVVSNGKRTRFYYESKFGEMRGPIRSKFIGAGDFLGNGKVAWLIWSQDSWGTSVSMVTLSKAGKPTVVETTGFGD